jgi:hypothetical protein
VRKTPVGQILGSVISSPAGIICGLDCVNASASFANGTVVMLTVQPVAGSTFHWTGDCAGSGSCVVTMDADKGIVLHFTSARSPAAAPTDTTAAPLFRSRLTLSGGRGEVSVDGRTVSVGAGVETTLAADAGPGDHLVEAWVREGAGEGVWRFSLGPPSAPGRSIRNVLAGDPVSLTPDAVVFRVRARLPQKVAFVVSAR